MPSTNLTLSDNQTLAEYAPVEAFTGLLQNRYGVSPDHAALLIRDGRIVDAFVGAHFAVGGLWQRLKEAVGGTHALRLLLVDLKPFQVRGEIDGISKDGVAVPATVAIDFQVDVESPANILGLMPEHGALAKADVYARVQPHLGERVFRTALTMVDASGIRGNTALQDKVQADVFLEVQRLCRDLGVLVRAVSVTWALNDADREAMQRSASEREQALLDYRLACKKREILREREATEFTLRTDTDVEKIKASTEDELRTMVLQQELAFVDARQAGVRAAELKTLDHELLLLTVQRRAGYQQALDDAQNEVDRADIQRKLSAIGLEIDAMKTEQRLRLEKLQEEQQLAIAEQARRQQLETLRQMGAIEAENRERERLAGRDDRLADAEMKLKASQQASLNELERLKLQAQMSPDQILAISAGLSPDVARVFAERAKVGAIDMDKREALLREMVQLSGQGRMASEEQARFFFDKAMQAHTPAVTVLPEREPETIECPECHKRSPVTDRFCRYCSHALRV